MCSTRVTEADLRTVWAQLQPTQSSWPPSFEDTMADPVRSRLVRIAAARAAHGHPVAAERTARRRAAVIDPGIHRPVTADFPTRTAPIDRKRAAAGERVDD